MKKENTEKKHAEAAYARYVETVKKCSTCYWARVYEGIIYCLSTQGTCMRKEFRGEYDKRSRL